MTRHVRIALRILAAWSTLAMIIACGFAPELEESSSSSDPVEVPAAPDLAEPAQPTAAAGGACSRIQDCCRAYVAEMGNLPPTTCDAYANATAMPESACTQTMAGYRQGLTALGRDVPAACAE